MMGAGIHHPPIGWRRLPCGATDSPLVLRLPHPAVFWLVLLLLLPTLLRSQDRFDHLSLEEGVAHNLVYCMAQDRAGMVWLGGMYGLVRYDGFRFEIFRHSPLDTASLSFDDIVSLYEDRAGHLWVGTWGGGLNRFDPETRRAVRYLSDPAHSGALASDQIWSVAETLSDSGRTLWVGTSRGLYRLDLGPWPAESVIPPPADGFVRVPLLADSTARATVNALLVDAKGRLLVASDHGLYVNQPGRPFRFTRVSGAGTALPFRVITALHEEPDGSLWLGTVAAGAVRFRLDDQGRASHARRYHTGTGLPADFVHGIIADNRGRIWIGTTGGLARLDAPDAAPRVYRHRDGDPASLPGNDIIALLEDRQGVIWVSTYHGGVSRYNPSQERYFHVKHLPADSVRSGAGHVTALATDNEALWIGGNTGMFRLDAGAANPVARPWPVRRVRAVAVSNENNPGRVWVGTARDGLFEFANDGAGEPIRRWRRGEGGLPSDAVTALGVTAGRLWVGTPAGLASIDPGDGAVTTWRGAPGDSSGLPHPWVLTLFDGDSTALWIGTYGGLSRLDLSTERFTHFRHDRRDPLSLSNDYVYDIHRSETGVFWFATTNGLNRWDGPGHPFASFGLGEGLPNAVINSVVSDGRGRIWAATNLGLARLDTAGAGVRSFDRGDGLPALRFFPGTAAAAGGRLWFGGPEGLVGMDPHDLTDKGAPRPGIAAVTVDGQPRAEISPYRPLPSAPLHLPSGTRSIAIELATPDLRPGDRHRIQYRVVGTDSAWIDLGGHHRITLSGLAPGAYRLEVAAVDGGGRPGALTMLPLRIAAPLWQRWWFLLLSAVAVAAVAVLLHRRRLRRILDMERVRVEERDRVRRQTARDYHDELGHQLAKISLFSALLDRELAGSDDGGWREGGAAAPDEDASGITTYLQRIQGAAARLCSDTRDFIWSLNPEKDSLFDTLWHLKVFGDDLFGDTDVDFQCTGIPESFSAVRLPMETRRQLTLIFKEAMTNAFKHAGADRVRLSASVGEGNVEIALADDGCGFGARRPKPGGGNGLGNMARRAETLAGTVTIESPDGGGTRVRFRGAIVDMQ